MCEVQPITTEGRYAVTTSKNDKPISKNQTHKAKKYTMMMNTTLEQLRNLKLAGMATGLQEQLTQTGMTGMSFEERFALLVDREVHWRSDKRQARLLKAAHLKYPQACIEDIDTRAGRGLERSAVMSLALGNWIESGHSVLVTGLTGAGKTWLACALAQYACRRGHTALYQRVPRLGEELRIRHGNGTFGKWLIALAKTDVLLLDDWGMAGIDSQTRADLLEIIDDRAGNKATIITSQLPIEHWHAWIGDATIADAILDRVLQKNHRFNLMGESLRGNAKSAKSATPETQEASQKLT
jgi:DNA replication protein DnaC